MAAHDVAAPAGASNAFCKTTRKRHTLVSHERLKEVLRLDLETSVFFWKKHKKRRFVGAPAGYASKDGHKIRIDGVIYGADRLVAFYLTGEWPQKKRGHVAVEKQVELTHGRLLSILFYNEDDGWFYWTVRKSQACPEGSRAGYLNDQRYYKVEIDGRTYAGHRLAVFYKTGEWPERDVDHEDRDPGNNRWSNLRPCTDSQNKANTKCRSDSASGIKGVRRLKSGNFCAKICIKQKQINLGTYKTAEQAHSAYVAAAKKYFGEFARGK